MNIDLEGKLSGALIPESVTIAAVLAKWRQTPAQKAAIRAKWAALPKGSGLVFNEQDKAVWITPLKLSA